MALTHIVKEGDCISSIAFENGLLPETIWDHKQNAGLKEARLDPNTLCAGDSVFVPDKRIVEVSEPTNQVHKFVCRNTPARLNLQMFDNDEYRANQEYELVIDGKVKHKGKTDSEGILRVPIQPNARGGLLTIGPDRAEFKLQIGELKPPTEIQGVQARLNNLGYECSINGQEDNDFRWALRSFQRACGLEETGKIDDTTRRRLDELHDNICDLPDRTEVKNQTESEQ